jgi:short-subunit dehydrogenase
MAVYYASKAYVLSLSEALHEELKGQGVSVTALCPGPTRTGFQERAQLDGSRLKRLSMMEAGPVAAAGYRALVAGRPVTVPGWLNAILAFSTRLMPRAWTARLSGFLAKKEP